MVRADQIDGFYRILLSRGVDAALDHLHPAIRPTAAAVADARPRVVSYEAGRALELLGHAIEYLVDEYVHAGGGFCEGDPEFEAIQILMATNRAIYLSCPIRLTLFERLRRKLGL